MDVMGWSKIDDVFTFQRKGNMVIPLYIHGIDCACQDTRSRTHISFPSFLFPQWGIS